jgi:hypothetical protein
MGPEAPNRSTAYRHGWHDGRYTEPCCFTENRRLSRLEAPSDRLDYYRGHREGRESRARDARLPEAS